MLALSRKRGETVRIGQDITVTFLGVRGELCGGDGSLKPVAHGSQCDQVAPPVDC